MTLHRPRRAYSPAYARRQLARVAQALASVRALPPSPDWRQSAAKAATLRRLEAQQRHWQRVLQPGPPERFYTLPI